ncbi:MAG: type II toxin-antitoxin system RelE/ParE family toxin [Treponema sp.]|nr:type II toxin-antitoxin system RelE/ParE family toxin [Treponema sp.]
MTREFVYTAIFRKCWNSMGLNDESLRELENHLLKNPSPGAVVQGTGGARKLRFQLGTHGKSGGARIIYVDIFEKERLYLLFAYPKNVQDDLTPEQKKSIKQMIECIKQEA